MIDAQIKDRQALQEKIRAVRDRHAALLKELRQDQQAVRQMARQAEPEKEIAKEARTPSMDQRLERLRKGERGAQTGRKRDLDRER